MAKKAAISKSKIALLDAKNVPFKGPFLVLVVLMFLAVGVFFVVSTFAATVGSY